LSQVAAVEVMPWDQYDHRAVASGAVEDLMPVQQLLAQRGDLGHGQRPLGAAFACRG
jgi:hypothetical protein